MAKKKQKTEKDFAEDGLIREVNDELKQDKLHEIWKKYGNYIIAFVVLLIGATATIEGYKSWKSSVEAKEAKEFVSAISDADNLEMDAAITSFEKISNSARTDFKDLAKLQIANIYLKNSKIEEAITVLEEIYNDKSVDNTLRNVAAIKLVSHTIDTADADEIRKMLEPMTIDTNSFRYAAKEMLALLELREGNLEGSKAIYEELTSDTLVAAGIKKRADEMLALINR